MQNLEEIFEIDLTSCENSETLAQSVIKGLESVNKDAPVKISLRLDNVEVNQSQMVVLKSLTESYGHVLFLVVTSNELTKDICKELQINTSGELQSDKTAPSFDIKGIIPSNGEEKEENKGGFVGKKHGILVFDLDGTSNISKDEKIEENKLDDVKKQTIGVYRKADEQEQQQEIEEVDFYETATDEPVVFDTKKTIYITQTLRSGQILDYDGNVVIIGDCHPGSEIKATGDITVWGVLGSIAHAGIKGNREAKIRALKMHAIQLRIADCYSRRPDEGNIPYVIKSSEFTPEEARIVEDNIVLFKMAQN